jgi:hypothetical protein
VKPYVPVRVTDLAGVDLSRYRFDYNLTFAALLMNADGTIYHTFGGRDWRDPMSHLTMPALVRLLNDTVTEHAAYQRAPAPPKLAAPFTIEQYPTLERRIKAGRKPDCMHCHMVGEYKYSSWKEQGRYRLDDFMNYPDPIVIGETLKQEPQTVVESVVKGSPAAKTGVKPGSRILSIGDTTVSTFGDIQRALHEAPARGHELKIMFALPPREPDGKGTVLAVQLRLKKRWKHMTPLQFAWRPDKWAMWPRPGFGGRTLNDGQLKQHGLPPGTFAIRVGYVVTWGDVAFIGRAAQKAGVRKGTILLGVDGKRDFESEAHFQAWFRMTRRLNTPVKLEVWEQGKRKVLTLVPVDR